MVNNEGKRVSTHHKAPPPFSASVLSTYSMPPSSWIPIFSKHRPSEPILSISQNVRMFVCVFVCLSLGKSNGKKVSQI